MEYKHVSVLLNECIDGLKISPSGVYIDGTAGGGGHSLEICKRLGEGGRLICIDQDINAINAAKDKLSAFKNVTYIHDNFSNILEYDLGNGSSSFADGVLLDLGVSSHQLDETERGFSYNHDAPLDMRMDRSKEFSAFDVVNKYSEDELYKIIMDFGEERWAKRIAQFIVNERSEKTIDTTGELVSVIKKAVPKGARQDGPHPAKRTFQAIRIEVNRELSVLADGISYMAGCLKKGGRLCIITFHSLEDRIVKNAFRRLENPCTCPPDFPVCICGKERTARVVTRKPITPCDEELSSNPRARSAKLRILEKY